MNNSSSSGGTVLPAGCTPHCFKSSQLVRRASETINISNNLIKDSRQQQQQQHQLSGDAIINCQQDQQQQQHQDDDDDEEEEEMKENDALLGTGLSSSIPQNQEGDDTDAIAPSTKTEPTLEEEEEDDDITAAGADESLERIVIALPTKIH